MYTILNINSWKRKEHFEFFKAFDQPYFGMETKVDISKAYQICKANNWSLFLYYHFLSQKAVNQTEAFRYRLIQDEVRLYEHLHVNTNMFR
ncbi:MAG: hypothetical protein KDC24_15355, partial [Saprospiraceae bacterium]|nr:hypothetical protein [Saprospiraceae bacterium]